MELQDWVGQQETSSDAVTPALLDRFAATLDREESPARTGDALPPLGHWTLLLPSARQSRLGPDGHPARGGFLPPLHHLPRRMWAGGRLAFSGIIRAGMQLTRTSTVTKIAERTGSSGPLVFVTVQHKIYEAGSERELLTEEHDIVYRGVEGQAVRAAQDAPEAGLWHRALIPDETLLFRYSALTFNGHRIHYDREYVTKVELYPGLVVHGPLIATLLLDLVRRHLPDRPIREFAFRALSPVFDGNILHLNGTPPGDDGKVLLWATNHTNGLTMRAEAVIG